MWGMSAAMLSKPLSIYFNNHLAGATAESGLAKERPACESW